jgi:hypothetical protein
MLHKHNEFRIWLILANFALRNSQHSILTHHLFALSDLHLCDHEFTIAISCRARNITSVTRAR